MALGLGGCTTTPPNDSQHLRGVAAIGGPLAHARIDGMDTSAALALPGVKAVLSAADIVGENQIGVVFADEPLLAEGEICYAGQVLALVVAYPYIPGSHTDAFKGIAGLVLKHSDEELDSRYRAINDKGVLPAFIAAIALDVPTERVGQILDRLKPSAARP